MHLYHSSVEVLCPHPHTGDPPCRYFSCVRIVLCGRCFRLTLTRMMRPVGTFHVCLSSFVRSVFALTVTRVMSPIGIFRVFVSSLVVNPFAFTLTPVYTLCRSFSCVCFVTHCNYFLRQLHLDDMVSYISALILSFHQVRRRFWYFLGPTHARQLIAQAVRNRQILVPPTRPW